MDDECLCLVARHLPSMFPTERLIIIIIVVVWYC